METVKRKRRKTREIKRRRNGTKWGTDVPLGPWSCAAAALDFHQTLSLIPPLFSSPLLLLLPSLSGSFDCKWLTLSAS